MQATTDPRELAPKNLVDSKLSEAQDLDTKV